MGVVIKAGSTTLPSPEKLTTSNEIIWSSNTGRSSSGKMIGDVVAEKTTFAITWGILTKSERDLIRSKLASGFHDFSVVEDGTTTTITGYRSTLQSETVVAGGETFYKNLTVSIIQQ